MRATDRVLQSLRRLGRGVPTSVKGPLGRATRPLRRFEGPLVTVVLAVSDDETSRISVCLDTLRAQTHRNLEILLVRYGAHALVDQIGSQHAAGDWRIRVVGKIFATQAQARNYGLDAAKGDYVLCVAGGDDLPEPGIAHLVEALENSGSDIAVGKMMEPLTVRKSVAAPYEAAHRTHVIGATLPEAPVAITDLGLGNRLLRASFLKARKLRFADSAAGPAEFAARTYAEGRFDLLIDGTYVPNGRTDGLTVGAMERTLPRLGDWIAQQQAVAAVIDAVGSADVESSWRWGVLDAAIHAFLDDVESASDQQWESLRREVESILSSAPEDWDARLSAEAKVKLWLLRQNRRCELENYVAARWLEERERDTEVIDGAVVAKLPFYGDASVGIPQHFFEMPDEHTPMRAEVRQIRRRSDGFDIDVAARIDYVSYLEQPEVEVNLLDDGGQIAMQVPITQARDLDLNNADGHRYQDYSHGLVTLHLDADALATLAGSRSAVTWPLELTVRTRGLSRTGRITRADVRANATLISTGALAAVDGGGSRVSIARTPAGFSVKLAAQAAVRLAEASVTGRTLTGRLEPGADQVTAVRVELGNLHERSRVSNASFRVEIPRPYAESVRRTWRLMAITASGVEMGIGWPAGWDELVPQPHGALAPARSAEGEVELVEAADTLLVDEVHPSAERVLLRGRWLGLAPTHVTLRLVSPVGEVSGTVQTSPGGPGATVEVEFPLTWDRWGLGAWPLPMQRWFVRLNTGPAGSRRGTVWLSEKLLPRLLESEVTDYHRFRTIRMGREAGIFLRPALDLEDMGPYAQMLMQREALTSTAPIDPDAVYLQSYTGAWATDSQLAIHRELRRTHRDLKIYWCVFDAASWVPEGAIPVLLGSRQWYQALSTSKYLCLNIDFDRWFRKRPGQQVLSTFHGYPAKSMGKRMWTAKGYTPLRVAQEIARTSGSWDLILTPSPEMDHYYRTEYDYDGAIHSHGYPRDDVLVGAEADAIRRDTRARLGIAEHQKVILYAPTWRDDQALNWRLAEMVRHLDLDDAMAELGEDYVFLVRGHRFMALSNKREQNSANLIDVTDYPEINDLILASDAAVLDYSSLRFDFSLTNRPMVFLVPDLASYTGGVRGFLYPFTESAPGPLAQTSRGVIEHLHDLDKLSREHADQYAEFHRRYNRYMDGRAAQRVVQAFFGGTGSGSESATDQGSRS